MALRGKKRFIAAGLACTRLFVLLLLVRTDIISLRPAPLPAARVQTAGDPGTGARWMVILQDGKGIGTSYSRLASREGGYRLTENVRMRLNTMGLAQDLVLESSAWLNSDLSMARFNVKMTSGLFTFAASGLVEDGHPVCRVRSGNDERPLRLPLLAPTAFEQSDHPDIRTLAARLTVPDDPPLANLQRLVDWLQTHMERRPECHYFMARLRGRPLPPSGSCGPGPAACGCFSFAWPQSCFRWGLPPGAWSVGAFEAPAT